MMETQAEERSALQDRMEWRLARERIQARVREDAWEGAFREEMSGQLEVMITNNKVAFIVTFVVRQS